MELTKPLLEHFKAHNAGEIELKATAISLLAKNNSDLFASRASALSSIRLFESNISSSKTTVIKYKSAFQKFVVLKKKPNTLIVAQNSGLLGKFDTSSQKFVGPLVNTGLEEINSIVVTVAENYVFVSGKKNDIKVYELNIEGLILKTELTGHTDVVSSLTLAGDKLLSISADKSLRQWNLTTFEGEVVHQDFPEALAVVASSPKHAFVADVKGQIFQLDLAEKKVLKTKTLHEVGITAMKIGRLHKYLVSGDSNGEIKVWSTATFELIKSISNDTKVTSIAFGERDAMFAVGGDSDVVIYDTVKKANVLRYEGHNDDTLDVHFHTQDEHSYIYSSSSDKSLRIWSYFKSTEETNIIKAEKLTSDIEHVYQFDKYLVVLGSEWQVWNLNHVDETTKKEGQKLIATLSSETELSHELEDVKYSARHNLLIVISSTTGVYVYNTITWELVKHLNDEDNMQCVFHPNLAMVYIADLEGKIFVRSLPNLEKVQELQEDGDSLYTICYASKKNLLFTGGEGKTVFVWDLATNTCIKKLSDESEDIYEMRLTPDEKYLIVVDETSNLYIWNLEDYSLETTIPRSPEVNQDESRPKDEDISSQEIEGTFLSDDGKYLFVAWNNKIIRVWSMETRTKVTCISVEEDIETLTMSANGGSFYYTNSEGISKVPNPILNTEFEIYNPLLSLNETYKYLYKIIIEKKQVEYNPAMDFLFIAPYNLTMSSIYSYYGLVNHLKRSLKSRFSITRDFFGFSPFSAALESKNMETLDILIRHLVEALSTNKFVSTLVHDLMVDLNKVSPPSLHLLYQALWRTPTNVKLAQFSNESTSLPLTYLDNSINIKQVNFFEKDNSMGVGEPTEYKESLIPLDYTLGSARSLKFLSSLEECQNEEIFKTHLIREVLLYKWNKAKYFVLFQTILYLIYMVLLTWLTCGGSNKAMEISLLVTNGLLFGFELMQMIIGGLEYWKESWNYVDLIRSCLCFLYIFGLWFENATVEGYTNEYLALLTLFSWARGISYFRLFKGTRYFINLLFAVFEDMGSFLVLLIYCTLSYVFIRMIYDHEGTFATHLADSFKLNLGDIGNTSEDAIEWIVLTLMMMINPIIMLNLLISILSDTYARVQSNSAIADMKELNDMILEVEQTMFWNKSFDNPKYLTKCYAKGSEENLDSGDPMIGSLLKKVISLKAQNVNIITKFEELKSQHELKLAQLEGKFNVRGRHNKTRLENLMNMLAQVASKIDPEISTQFEPLSDSDAEQNADKDIEDEYDEDEDEDDEDEEEEQGGEEEQGEGNEDYEKVDEDEGDESQE